MSAIEIVYVALAFVGVGLNFLPEWTWLVPVKPIASYFLVFVAWTRARSPLGAGLPLGMTFGTLGDIFLAAQSRAWFLPGLAAFLVGHVCYTAAFARRPRFTASRAVAIAGIAGAVAVLGILLARRLPAVGEAALLPPVLVYAAMLTTMAAAAILSDAVPFAVAAGTAVFVLSDAHIAVNEMLLDRRVPAILHSGVATYLLAQGLIVLGAARIGAPAATGGPPAASPA